MSIKAIILNWVTNKCTKEMDFLFPCEIKIYFGSKEKCVYTGCDGKNVVSMKQKLK